MNKQIAKYILRIIIFTIPVLLLIFSFVFFDPFFMFHHERPWAKVEKSRNDDFRTVDTYLKYNDSLQYNAFLFGNSRTLAFLSTDWKKFIGKEKSVYKFGSPGESLLGIRKKLELIDKNNGKIDNALLILDTKILENVNNTKPPSEGPVYLKGPLTSNNSLLDYYFKGFYFYLYNGFFAKYLICLNSEEETEKTPDLSLVNKFMTMEEYKNLKYSNEFLRWDSEQKFGFFEIQDYTSKETDYQTENIFVDDKDKEHLQVIKTILDKHNTDYYIIFGPEYECFESLNSLQIFETIFEKELVKDFRSDTNFCNKENLFYEPNHYRPLVGLEIMKLIYF
jgi:hypothetical protein